MGEPGRYQPRASSQVDTTGKTTMPAMTSATAILTFLAISHANAASRLEPAITHADSGEMKPESTMLRSACACSITPGTLIASGSHAVRLTGAAIRSSNLNTAPNRTGFPANRRCSDAVSPASCNASTSCIRT